MKSTLALMVLLLTAAPAQAQGLLRFQKDERSRRYDVYMLRVAEGVAGSLAAWNEAWSDEDPGAIARTYRKDATLYLPNEVVHGRAAIEDYFGQLLSTAHGLSLLPGELKASGDMAYRVVVVRYQTDQPGAEAARGVERRDLFVYRKRGDNDWEIQAHFTGPEAGAGRGA